MKKSFSGQLKSVSQDLSKKWRTIWNYVLHHRVVSALLMVVLVLVLGVILFITDFLLASHYQQPAFFSKVFGVDTAHYDFLVISAPSAYIAGDDVELSGTIDCYLRGQFICTVPFLPKYDPSFDLTRIGDHFDEVIVGTGRGIYSYTVFACEQPVLLSIASLKTEYMIGDALDDSATLILLLNTGEERCCSISEAVVYGFDTTAAGVFEAQICFEMNGASAIATFQYTVFAE